MEEEWLENEWFIKNEVTRLRRHKTDSWYFEINVDASQCTEIILLILNDPEWQSGTNGSKITFTLMVAYFAKTIYWSFWLPLFGGKGYFAANGKNGYIAMKIKVLHAKILCARCVHVKLCTVEEIWTLECTYLPIYSYQQSYQLEQYIKTFIKNWTFFRSKILNSSMK